MTYRQRPGEDRNSRERGGDHTEAESADQPASQSARLLLQTLRIGRDPLSPREHSLAFRGQALESFSPLYHEEAELLLELLDPRGERRLGHVAGRGRPCEVSFPGERREILEVLEDHQLAIIPAALRAGNVLRLTARVRSPPTILAPARIGSIFTWRCPTTPRL